LGDQDQPDSFDHSFARLLQDSTDFAPYTHPYHGTAEALGGDNSHAEWSFSGWWLN
jgi:hypothetical protein